MKFFTFTKSLTALGFLMVGGIASASTLTFTQVVTIGPDATDVNQANSNAQAVFNLFGSIGAPAGSTLTGVSLTENIAETLSALTITNNNSTTASAKYTASANLDAYDSANGTDGTSLDSALAANSGNSAVTIFNTGTQTYTAGQVKNYSASLPAALTENTGAIAGTTSSYTGTGTFDLAFSTLSGFTVQGGGNNVNSAQTTSAAMTATVTYTYSTPSGTPEPSTFVLLGGALVALGSLRNRKKAA